MLLIYISLLLSPNNFSCGIFNHFSNVPDYNITYFYTLNIFLTDSKHYSFHNFMFIPNFGYLSILNFIFIFFLLSNVQLLLDEIHFPNMFSSFIYLFHRSWIIQLPSNCISTATTCQDNIYFNYQPLLCV